MALDEFARIATYFAPLAAGAPGAYGLTDDAAVVEPAVGNMLVVTTDCLVGGVHFPLDDPVGPLARKALRVNLSDIAAMGGRARGYTLALALPETMTGAVAEAFLAELTEGLRLDQEIHGIHLLGGDSVKTPGPLTLTITMLGEVARGCALLRSGARPGDDIYVSGTIGDGSIGLLLATGEIVVDPADARARFLLDRFRLPTPRMALGPELIGVASACLDVSDGLLQDLGHVLETSGVGAEIDAEAVPVSEAARWALEIGGLGWESLMAGDDYELLFTAPAERAGLVRTAAERAATPVTRIGSIVAGSGASVTSAERGNLRLGDVGYRHA